MTNEPMIIDSALVAGMKKGEGGAFESLISRYQTRIFAVAFRITRNREDAQDVVQQSFHKAFLHLDTFQGKSSFSTWLTKIAINEALMCVRKNRVRSEFSFEDMNSEPDSFPMEIPDNRKGPAELYEQNEEKQILSRAISRLNLDSRTALLLRLEERSVAEAAEILGVGIGTLKARLCRARHKLRTLLEADLAFHHRAGIAA